MSDEVTFKLNGKEVSVPKGMTVMEAASREGVAIPHFCWHPGLELAGVCRFCMVEIVGRPKLEIACNLEVTEGLEVSTISEKTREAHKWALEFHLVNHPLDCPICDQAGECKLQDFYMEVGKYKSQMTRPKVLKPKCLDVGSELVLDTERCILCSRCVRFEEEVTKTGALGIFDRGDRAIIGTYKQEKISHGYQENLVDICPVGAFTSKSFRFKKRVWFLEEKESICLGCASGCAVSVHGRSAERRYYRLKPRFDPEVNGHWMCDLGRKTFTPLNSESRLDKAYLRTEAMLSEASSAEVLAKLSHQVDSLEPQKIALLIAPQYTNEEYEAFLRYFVVERGIKNVFQWREPGENLAAFDGILLRGDRNPNTQGLLAKLSECGLGKDIGDEYEACLKSKASLVIALAPQNWRAHELLATQISQLAGEKDLSLWTLAHSHLEIPGISTLIPMKGFYEKTGTTLNFSKRERHLKEAFPAAADNALAVTEALELLRERVAHLQGS